MFIQTSDLKWFAFGCNSDGELGMGDTGNRSIPTELKSPNFNFAIKRIFCGRYHNFIKTQDNKFYCFGLNDHAQLGLGDTKKRIIPVEFSIQRSNEEGNDNQPNKKQKTEFKSVQIKSAICGAKHTIISTINGKYYCFGYHYYEPLGVDNEFKSPSTNSNILFFSKYQADVSNWKIFRSLLIAREKNMKSIFIFPLRQMK